MNKRKPVIVSLLLVSYVFELTNSIKVWKDYPDFDNPDNWQSGYLPCSLDEIVFPDSYSSSILLPSSIDTTGITLPKDGALLLQSDSVISFSSGINNDRKCKNSNQVAKIKAKPSRHWFDPQNWNAIGDDNVISLPNAAVPHLERIPCNNERVRVNTTGALSIDLSDVRTLRVGQVELDGTNVSKDFMEQLFRSELGEVMFKYASLTKVEYYNDPMCGCHQGDLFLEYELSVCQNMRGVCERPKCMTPIIATGHCCAICGVMLRVFVDACNSSYPGKLKQMIERSLKEQEMEEQLIYHVSFLQLNHDVQQPSSFGTYLQVIIMEKDGYDGSSVKFLSRFNETVAWDVFDGSKKEFSTAGRPYNPNGLGAALLLMACTLIGVLVFFAVIFVNFIPENGIIRPPRWMLVRWNDFFQSPFVFARFDNTAAAEGDTTENVVIDVQQYNAPPVYSERKEGTSTSFDNPMFVENPPVKSAAQDDDDIPLREEDLTEIDLESEIEGKL